jgi:hypothetical protein
VKIHERTGVKEMKKLASMVLVLAMASLSQAVTVDLLSGGLSSVSANPGDTITVDLVSDTDVASIDIPLIKDDAATQGDVTDTAAQVQDKIHANLTSVRYVDGVDLAGNVLVKWVIGYRGAGKYATAGEDLVSFDYKLDAGLTPGTSFTIYVAEDLVEPYYTLINISNGSGGSVDSGLGAGDIGVLTINVVPEPATVALLGLGSLVLLRHRKKH